MAGLRHAPTGRAGRLWLQQRLGAARKGAELLDHKLRALRVERERLGLRRERTAVAWAAASNEADSWLLRGVLLGGRRSVRLATHPAPALVEIVWEQRMGVSYPDEGTCTPPEPSASLAPPVNAALVRARECYGRALQAAVRHAVNEAAVGILEAQELATRRRLRAIEDRWIPQVSDALADVQFSLDEEEHSDGVRLRWIAGRQADARHRNAAGPRDVGGAVVPPGSPGSSPTAYGH